MVASVPMSRTQTSKLNPRPFSRIDFTAIGLIESPRPDAMISGVLGSSVLCRDLPFGAAAPDFPPDRKEGDLLALAEANQAEFLVTGDKQLLSLNQHKTTQIVTAIAMVETLKVEARE